MKKTFFLLSLLCVIFLFASCTLDEIPNAESITELDQSINKAAQGDHDSYLVWAYPKDTYTDIAVSNDKFYLLRKSNKDVEIRKFSSAGVLENTLGRNYDAIDYVTSGTWKLIGADNTNDIIHVNAESSNKITIPYPSGVTNVYGIACKHVNNYTLEIYLKVPNQYFASHVRKITYIKSPENIIYDGNIYPYGAYSSGLAYCEYDNSLLQFLHYFDNIYFIRRTPPDGTNDSENLGIYDYHVYLYMDKFDIFSPIAFDYCPNNGNYYGLDYNVDRGCQAIVGVNKNTVNW